MFIDKIEKKKVRPIVLSLCVGKLMERMVVDCLLIWLEKRKLLHSMQNGFRRGRSCAENLVKIVADIKNATMRNDYTLAAFLDVSAAYDNVQSLPIRLSEL